MSKAFSKVLVITLMLVAFVGQAFAYSAMSCEMSLGSHESHMNMEHSKMSHHEGMEHGDMNKSSNGQSEDCCGVCVCQLAVFLQTHTGGGVFLRADVWRGNVRAISTKD